MQSLLQALRAAVVASCVTLLLMSSVYAQKWSRAAAFPEPAEEVYGIAAGGKFYVFGGLAPGWTPKRKATPRMTSTCNDVIVMTKMKRLRMTDVRWIGVDMSRSRNPFSLSNSKSTPPASPLFNTVMTTTPAAKKLM